MRELGFLDNLIHVHRYSGNPLIKAESVADHTWCMNALALEYIPKLNEKFNTKYDISKVIYGITLHDVDESLYCDIPRNFKYYNPELRKLIGETVDSMVKEKLPNYYTDINYYDDKCNIYGYIIKVFDIAQAGIKMATEINLGNSYFKNEIHNALDSLSGMRDLASKMILEYREACIWLCDELYAVINNLIES